MTSRLKNSISDLYETFEKYRSGPAMSGSPLYSDLAKWNEDIFSKSLAELNEDDLSRFVGKSITTWGNENDYKHFLPRIFELTAEFRTPYEIWIAFGKLEYGEWHTWPENEQKVIHEFMLALWQNIVNDNSEKAEWEFKDYFSSIAHFYPNFSDLINIWWESDSKASIKHLADFLIDEQTAIFDRKKISGFYDKKENTEEFIAWVLSDRILEKMQQKYFEYEKESFSEKISWAEQIIVQERKSYCTQQRI